jgi:uncharacterized protein (DUF2236 family)
MAVTGPLQRATDAGSQLALTPLRLLEGLGQPLRADLSRDVRRALGVPDEPAPPEMDPETAYFDPAGVTRRVHADLPSMIIAGVSALFLQTLHPLAMAGVAEHSNYHEDPQGRLRRTAAFVGTTTYGTTQEATRAIAQVRRVHRRVHGVAPDGRAYSADDPDLVTWVHVAEMRSFFAAAQRFGPDSFTRAEQDAYFAETAVIAHELGAQWVPTSVDELDAYFQRMRPQLYAGTQAFVARDFLRRGVAHKPEDRVVYSIIVAAAIGLLPGWARAELRIPQVPLLDATVVTPAARGLCAVLRWAIAPGGPERTATEEA